MRSEKIRVALFGEPRTVSHVRKTLSLCPELHVSEFSAARPLAGFWSTRSARIVHGVMASSMWKIFRRAKQNGAATVNHWIGTDVQQTLENPRLRSALEEAKPYIDLHVAVAPWTSKELEALGLEAAVLPIVSVDLEQDTPEPPARHGVLVYATAGREDFYGLPAALALAREFPEIPFFICGGARPAADTPANVSFQGMLGREAMSALYKETSILLRLPAHDGLSKMVLEALGRGKAVIWNHPFPGVRVAANLEEARKEFRQILEKPPALNSEGRQAVEKGYLPIHAAGRFAALYGKLLDRGAPRG